MTDINNILPVLEKAKAKWQLRCERARRLRDTNNPKYNEFMFGKAIGNYQAICNIIQEVNNLNK